MSMSRELARPDIWTQTSDQPAPGTYDQRPPIVQPSGWAAKLRYIKPPPVIQLARTKKRPLDEGDDVDTRLAPVGRRRAASD
jgi:hypothetical protein